MSKESLIVKAVCGLLAGCDLKARELAKLLGDSGLTIDRHELNRALYRAKDGTPGLSVKDGVWRFRSPTDSEETQRLVPLPSHATQPTDREDPVALPPHPSDSAPFVPSPEQRPIVEAGPAQWTLVEAGPGTGKTAVAIARVAHLLDHGMPPGGILMVSFTRTAVAELRQRIEALAKNGSSVASVRITTLDSEAWHLGFNFGGTRSTEKIPRGFDSNIEDAIALFKTNDPALCDWVTQTYHVIVDEAQDLVGNRAELVFQLFDHLPDNCGVTIFADPAQAIYGFADGDSDEGDDQQSPPDPPFHDKLLRTFPGQFEYRRLTTLFRTSTLKLRRIFAQGRETVLAPAPARDRFSALRELALTTCDATEAVDDRPTFGPDELVLFRRRSEVLLASSYLSKKKVSHRIRMAQTSLGLHSWVASLFGLDPANIIDRNELNRRWDKAAAKGHFQGIEREDTWLLLLRLAATNGADAVDLRSLRKLLARSRPPIEICQAETGSSGPILGTIHASKGREANRVSIMMPAERKTADAKDFDQEVRVTYVGTTRARHELLVGKGYVGYGFRSLGRGGRVYRASKKPGQVQVELGRPGDVDELAGMSKTRFSADEVRKSQSYLAAYGGETVELSVAANDDYTYVLRTPDGLPIGAFTSFVNKDLFLIAKAISPKIPRRPPKYIPFVSLVGVRAFAVSDEHPRLAEVCEPWAATGIFLVPVIRALTTMFLPVSQGREAR